MHSPLDSLPTPPESCPPPEAGPEGKSPRLRTWSSLGTVLFLVLLLAVAVNHIMQEVDFGDVWAYLDALPLYKVLEALGLTALGYVVLTLYDVSALRYLKIRVPYPTTALASFAGYAISNNVGFAVISGAGVRFRIYTEAGLTAADIAKVVVFSTTTFTLGIGFTGSIGVLLGPHPVAAVLALPDTLVQLVAGATLAGLSLVCLLTAITHRPVKLWRWSFQTPSGRIVLAQIIIASVEILISGSALWLLLPQNHGASFFEFIGIYCAALSLGILSHVPGGIGVFETIMLLGLSAQGSAGGVLGALLAFRVVYYVLPLFVAGGMLALYEIRMHKGRVGRLWDRLTGRGPGP
ncbi:lysylphosphatidylglycerol synthase domain-containing protein [Oleisolibacter albus]|uniref:lysylphosphatidylglycerol synthase domain-containing protein n=1 Tax=Oleisolibacter albus TaxID=2171757 RepID=UPI000DF3959A|nr:lysylphosphatidylglycerol synthase domain-containing protein [Oleisolibacter albus]